MKHWASNHWLANHWASNHWHGAAVAEPEPEPTPTGSFGVGGGWLATTKPVKRFIRRPEPTWYRDYDVCELEFRAFHWSALTAHRSVLDEGRLLFSVEDRIRAKNLRRLRVRDDSELAFEFGGCETFTICDDEEILRLLDIL